jgi:UDP-N-acetylglucosamine--dolichyl-phosphate N-acetylglucosaminephosphotransferase
VEFIYLPVLLASLALGLAFLRLLKGKMLAFGIGGVDINKEKKLKLPEAGGLLVLPAIVIVLLISVETGLINPLAYAFLYLISCFAAVGFFDDGFRIFKKEEGWARYVANRGAILYLMALPFSWLVASQMLGAVGAMLYVQAALGALAIVLAASLANSFAGLNGWEVGSSSILIGGLSVMAVFSQSYTSTLVSICLAALGAALALYYFNRFPSKVFPGDSGTLLMGSFIGGIILFIDYWYIAACLFFPHAYDILLKLRTNPSDMSQKNEKPYTLKDGKLHLPKSGKLDFGKMLIKKLGPMGEKELSGRIQRITLNNTLFWTLFYILVKII